MFTWEATRRTGDEWAVIHKSKFRPAAEDQIKVKSCTDSGAVPDYYDGQFIDCKKK